MKLEVLLVNFIVKWEFKLNMEIKGAAKWEIGAETPEQEKIVHFYTRREQNPFPWGFPSFSTYGS